MITSLAALAVLIQAPTAKLVEMPEADSGMIVMQAFVRGIDARTAHDAAVWDVLGHSLLEGTKELTAIQLRQYGGQAGYPPRVQVMPDYLMVQVVVPKNGLDLAGQLVESLILRPRLRDESIAEVVRRRQRVLPDPFYDALITEARDYASVTGDQVRTAHQIIFRPENVSVIVAGEFEVGAGAKELTRRFGKWHVERPLPMGRAVPGVPVRSSRQTAISSYELVAPTLTPATAFSGARILATIALGVGKDSTMFRVLREELALCYIEEGLLWPTRKGWEPRFILLQARPGDVAVLNQMKDALQKDVATWNEETLQRAMTLAKASLRTSVPFSPFWLSPAGPMEKSLVDRSAWRGYLTMAGSGGVDAELLADAVGQVDLETMKEQALKMLDEADGRMISARQ
mgnify:CR=1 FL=1